MTPEDDVIIKLPPGYTMVRNDTVQKWSAKARSELAQIAALRAEIVNDNEVIAELRAANEALRAEIEHLSDMNDKLVDVGVAYEKEREEAQAEISRLHAENERLNNLVGVQVSESFYRDFCKAKAETLRLRAALEEIAYTPQDELPWQSINNIARAALDGGDK